MPSAVLFVPVGSAGISGFTIGRYLAGATGLGSTSTRPSCRLQAFHGSSVLLCFVSEYCGMPHRCTVAHDVFSRSRVENEPATVHPVHNEFLLWSSNLVWLEQDLLTERCDLLIECFASANVDGRQCPCCMTYQPFQNQGCPRPIVAPICRSVQYLIARICHWMVWFTSLNATVGVAVSDWTFFVHDFGWDVRANFVFDVDDAGFLLALQHHFPMTCGQNVVCKCSFCVTMTRAFARYNVSKECLRQSVITS